MPDTSKLEKLNRELEKSEKKLRKAINDEKALQHQLKQLTRKERTHRLCTRGGMLESFLQEPERLTDDDVMLLLKLIFHRQDTQELLKKLLEREKPETPIKAQRIMSITNGIAGLKDKSRIKMRLVDWLEIFRDAQVER